MCAIGLVTLATGAREIKIPTPVNMSKKYMGTLQGPACSPTLRHLTDAVEQGFSKGVRRTLRGTGGFGRGYGAGPQKDADFF